MVKLLLTKWETRVRSLGREDALEKEMAPHSSTLAWKIPWKQETGGLQSMGSQRVGHDWTTSLSLCETRMTQCLKVPGKQDAMKHRKPQWGLILWNHKVISLFTWQTLICARHCTRFWEACILVLEDKHTTKLGTGHPFPRMLGWHSKCGFCLKNQVVLNKIFIGE